jgi:hypothetical protein
VLEALRPSGETKPPKQWGKTASGLDLDALHASIGTGIANGVLAAVASGVDDSADEGGTYSDPGKMTLSDWLRPWPALVRYRF